MIVGNERFFYEIIQINATPLGFEIFFNRIPEFSIVKTNIEFLVVG